MAYHESYGELPGPLMRLVRNSGVTPAEFDQLEWECGGGAFAQMEAVIRANLKDGQFVAPNPHIGGKW